ncbi:MAG: DNA topoisomerase VI subunit B [Candidatus Njordarchaeia archaeon]
MPPVKSISPAEFFASNRIIAGFTNPAKSLFTSIRELIENGLDAAEEAGHLPNIKIRLRKLSSKELERIIGITDRIRKSLEDSLKERKKGGKERRAKSSNHEVSADFYELTVEDNGIGMKWEDIPFLMGKVLTSTKYVLKQQRGRFGLGGKMVIIYSIQETNAPVEIWSTTKEDDYVSYYVMKIDLAKNEPIILEKKKIPKKEFKDPWGNRFKSGTIIRVYLLGNWSGAKNYILRYLQQLAIITPYANFLFEDPTGEIHVFERAVNKMPRPPEIAKYHPSGIDTQTLLELLKTTKAKTVKDFLRRELQRMGGKTVENFLKVVEIDPNMPVKKLLSKGHLISRIVEVARKYKFLAPDPSCLSPIGPELLEAGIRKILKPDFVKVVQRKPFSYGGHPMIVEVGVAYGGHIPPGIHLYRFANRIPLLYKEKSDVAWKVIEEIDWSNYKIQRDSSPIAIFVSIVSTRIPFPETSKDFIDDIDVLRREIKLGLQEALRRLREYISKKEKIQRKMKKKMILFKYTSSVASSISSILRSDKKYEDSPFALDDTLYAILTDIIDKNLSEEAVLKEKSGGGEVKQ